MCRSQNNSKSFFHWDFNKDRDKCSWCTLINLTATQIFNNSYLINTSIFYGVRILRSEVNSGTSKSLSRIAILFWKPIFSYQNNVFNHWRMSLFIRNDWNNYKSFTSIYYWEGCYNTMTMNIKLVCKLQITKKKLNIALTSI